MQMWKNHDLAEVVYTVIDNNFKEVGKYLPNNIKAVTTTERMSMSSTYLSEGLIVYDKTLQCWFKYISGKWSKYQFEGANSGRYERDISANAWINKTINIPFDEHQISSPTVHVYYSDGTTFSEVYGFSNITTDNDVILKTDKEFSGKVVII